MAFRFGFELEGFYANKTGEIALPPKEYPVDGFPGLVEFRTFGHYDLEQAYGALLTEVSKFPDNIVYKSEYTFSPEQKRELRKTRDWHKDQVDVQNVYGKKPRAIGNRTIASFQINISYLLSQSHTINEVIDGKIKQIFRPEAFGLLDIPNIVRRLDGLFAEQIKESNRQPGEYCIKGNRLEYRSAPNFACQLHSSHAYKMLQGIKKAVEG